MDNSLSQSAGKKKSAVNTTAVPSAVFATTAVDLLKETMPLVLPQIQRKLSIGSVNDPLESEADAMADKVMRMPETPFVQRKCAHCEEEEKVQRKSLSADITPFIQTKGGDGSGTASDTVTQQINATRGSGNSMDRPTQSFMESRFGTDFSNVKIHTGHDAIQMSRELNAQAFTVGSDIYFKSGKYDPSSDSGKHLLAHELTHTVQQQGGSSIQRSCTDGGCETCAGGWKTLRVTAYFRTRATRETMRVLREKINEAKSILANCCVRLLFSFDWRLLRGGGTFNWGGDTSGANYSAEAEDLGEGETFTGGRGIPMVVVDTVPDASAVTVTPLTDLDYTGPAYFAIPVLHGKTRSIAHEIGHIAGILTHTDTPGIMDGGLGTAVTEEYSTAVRAIAH
jgi:Domain of unknown function (DUF4157)